MHTCSLCIDVNNRGLLNPSAGAVVEITVLQCFPPSDPQAPGRLAAALPGRFVRLPSRRTLTVEIGCLLSGSPQSSKSSCFSS